MFPFGEGEKYILLVEDNPDDEALTLRAFQKNKIVNPVHVVRDGQEALDFLLGPDGAAPNRLPAVILLDLKLPKVEGLEVLLRLRADPGTRLQPVVIMTSSKEESDLITGYERGCNAYVRKPVEFDEFVSAVAELGRFWLLLNEPPPRRK